MICQSSAANAVVCARTMPAVSNSALNQDSGVPVIVALAYQKTASISNRLDLARASQPRCKINSRTRSHEFDLQFFFAKDRKCFCPFEELTSPGSHYSSWV